MSEAPRTHRDVIDLWMKRSEMAADTKAPSGQVRLWHHRGVIPKRWWKAVAAAARRRKFVGAAHRDLARMAREATTTP